MTEEKQKLSILEKTAVLGTGLMSTLVVPEVLKYIGHPTSLFDDSHNYKSIFFGGIDFEIVPMLASLAIGVGTAYLVKKGIDWDHNSKPEVD